MAKNTEKSQEQRGSTDSEADRYPTAKKGIQRVLDNGILPDESIERLEVNFLADGSATYRVWSPRAEEPVGGYLPVA